MTRQSSPTRAGKCLSSTFLLSLFLLCTGCETGPVEQGPSTLQFNLTVREDNGQPVSWIFVSARAWQSDTNFRLEAVPQDSAGALTLESTELVSTPPDSVVVKVSPDDCTGLAPTALTFFPEALQPPGNLDLAVTRVAQKARLGVAEACGLGFESGSDSTSGQVWVYIRFDSAVPTIAGRWKIAYQATRQTEEGHFTGVQFPIYLLLDLEPEEVFTHCDPRYRLHIGLAGDTMSIAQLEELPGGCQAFSGPFELYAVDEPTFP